MSCAPLSTVLTPQACFLLYLFTLCTFYLDEISQALEVLTAMTTSFQTNCYQPLLAMGKGNHKAVQALACSGTSHLRLTFQWVSTCLQPAELGPGSASFSSLTVRGDP